MNFFKHYTHGHTSFAMLSLMDEFGVEGYGAYFILMELCTAKIELKRGEKVDPEQMKFTFHRRFLREKLRMSSTRVERWLNHCATLELLKFFSVEDKFNIEVPKLLEFLDRGTKRGGTVEPRWQQRGGLDIDKTKTETKTTGGEQAKLKPVSSPTSPPPGYAAFEDRFNPERQELLKEAETTLEVLFGKMISPALRRRIPEVLNQFENDLEKFNEFCSQCHNEWQGKEPSYREVAFKRSVGLMAEKQ